MNAPRWVLAGAACLAGGWGGMQGLAIACGCLAMLCMIGPAKETP